MEGAREGRQRGKQAGREAEFGYQYHVVRQSYRPTYLGIHVGDLKLSIQCRNITK